MGLLIGAILAVVWHLSPRQAVLPVATGIGLAWLVLTRLSIGTASSRKKPLVSLVNDTAAREWLDDFLRKQQEK